ncbi:spore cortex biosynthesis protein YabQ [Lachnospiraceae bacterium MD335]|jgi:spore cortex biosynthesis protein YabQ|nr:spore cortex biosynthesis protein YabQ [Lachnospiraceae bacterium MD335]
MSENIIADLDLWIVSIATGVCMAFVYDLLRLFRRIVRHGRFAVDVEDLLYWTFCFFASFVILYYGNNGVIRFVAVFGAALGMLLYSVSIGRVFVKFSYFLINKTIGSAVRFLCRIIKKLHKAASSVNRKNRELLKKVGIFNKIQKISQYRLTHKAFRHKMDINVDKKEERSMSHGKKRITKKKDAGISTR